MVRTIILEALWQVTRHVVPTASPLCLNLYFPKPSATIHARSNTPLIVAARQGGDPTLIAQNMKERLMEEWGNQWSVTVTMRGTLAFRLTDVYIWSHVTESVEQWLPEAIIQASQAGDTIIGLPLPNDLLQSIQLTITHLDGAMMLLAEQGLTTGTEGSSRISSLAPSSHPPLTPLLCSLLLLPEYVAQATGSSKQQLVEAAIQHLLQTFNSYRAATPLLSNAADAQKFQTVVGAFGLLRESLRLLQRAAQSSYS